MKSPEAIKVSCRVCLVEGLEPRIPTVPLGTEV